MQELINLSALHPGNRMLTTLFTSGSLGEPSRFVTLCNPETLIKQG